MQVTKWPKVLPPLSDEQRRISDDFIHYWHEVLPRRFGLVEQFNHGYPVMYAPDGFRRIVYVHTPARYVWTPDFDARGAHPVARLVSGALRPLHLARDLAAPGKGIPGVRVIANEGEVPGEIAERLADAAAAPLHVAGDQPDRAIGSQAAPFMFDDSQQHPFTVKVRLLTRIYSQFI